MSVYGKITPTIIQQLQELVGDKFVLWDEETIDKYSHDETEDLKFFPEVVVKPRTATELSSIFKLCNEHLIPLTPRGAGTGLSGGALPVNKGILLSMERFNQIIEIDEQNLQATVEPGVITQVFQEAVKEKGLFYPPDPSSKGSCFIGGNLAENSGGPKAVKYGVTKDYVLNLEVVLPSGEIIWTGANVLKNSTGYNITQLMVGSEGTLGIITKAVFKLIPHPHYDLLMLVPFYSPEEACKAVSAIFRAGVIPSGLEFMERDALLWGAAYLNDNSIVIPENIQAHLLIELDGNDLDVLYKECEKIVQVLDSYQCDEILFAEDATQKEKLWKIRRIVGEAVKSQSIYKEEDTVVPRAELPTLLKGVKEIGGKYGFKSVCYGHAGDGNLHVNIIKENMSDEAWNNELPKGIAEIFQLCVQLKGTISGEHGIGYVQKSYMNIPFDEKTLSLQKQIKSIFDPNNILNPNKIFP
ncbi:MAG: FAD-binding protein [Flavobacteriales bacterium]|nr:FAD-binding protein [Flavobacteriales bacterium]MCW8913864.1 FAD-binding protein [Flavobacteriales bacterium]MCW8937429.1 FAD-binding protein [Flavobacteriales bacterium]MCW8940637.1 FAD-binding protein [Flavobacteriales bacterium]MCW8969093.1 FAD-binding protein [Flavobacteriales bacterium]